MALLSKEDVESIRTEVKEALEVEGGFTKDAINKFYKIDSALREVGRYYGLMHCTCATLVGYPFKTLIPLFYNYSCLTSLCCCGL
jgi:hypothetical protein